MSDERTFIHDLMTPLTVLDLNTKKILQLLESSSAPENIVERAQKIEKATQKLLKLTQERRKFVHERESASE